jgi:ceramide glucosyltransferase
MIADAGVLLTIASIFYMMLALWQMYRFGCRAASSQGAKPPVTIMLPVYGAPDRLYECLRACCDQDYPEYQVVFGLHRADDAGRKVIERVMREFPQVDMALVVDERRIGSNPKVCNLANMYLSVKHEYIVMVDSDVRVGRDFLASVVSPLTDPAVGAVTCLYNGWPASNLVSVLGAMHVNEWIAPSALVDLDRRPMDMCFGAVMAVSRRSLCAIGGLEALAFAVAEDDVLGQLLSEAGFRIVLSSYVVDTVVSEPDLSSLVQHELRWMRSVRACRPLDHALAVIVHGLLPATLLWLARPTDAALLLLMVLAGLRVALHGLVRQHLHSATPFSVRLVLWREALTFLVWLGSFLSWSMHWGDVKLQATGGRAMQAGAGGPAKRAATEQRVVESIPVVQPAQYADAD